MVRRSVNRTLPGWIFLVLALAASTLRAGDPPGDGLRPDPSLSPEQVVRIQLEALRRNDADDRGIAVAFRFASPENKRNTGPVPRFARMIKHGPYALMLSFSHASFAPTQVAGRQALQSVTLVAPGHAPVTYLFHLSRQVDDGPNKDCWMTEGVQVRAEAGRAA